MLTYIYLFKRQVKLNQHKTCKILPTFELLFEVAIKVAFIIYSYKLFIIVISYLKLIESSINTESLDLGFSFLIIPILYTLRDLDKIIMPFTVKVESCHEKVTVTYGLHPRVKDTLEYRNIENYEIRTTLLGSKFDYATVRLYSAGGLVEAPYIKNADDYMQKLNENRK